MGNTISLREWSLVHWICLVKPLVLIVGFAWWLSGPGMALALGLVYAGFKTIEILAFREIFLMIMRGAAAQEAVRAGDRRPGAGAEGPKSPGAAWSVEIGRKRGATMRRVRRSGRAEG